MSEGNPILVDEPRTGAGDGIVGTGGIDKNASGTGLFSDAANAIRDGENGNWGGLAVDALGGGLDYLSFVEDPLQGLLSAGIGWLIDHVSFLSEPLDYLAGNADLVTEKSQTWKNISQSLQQSSQDYSTSAQALTSQYTGKASSAYAASARNFADLVSTTAKHADNAATAMTVAGVLVGTTRGLVRDTISQFVSQAVEKWAITAATSCLRLRRIDPDLHRRRGVRRVEDGRADQRQADRTGADAQTARGRRESRRQGSRHDDLRGEAQHQVRSRVGHPVDEGRAAAAHTSSTTAQDLFKAAEHSNFHPDAVRSAITANEKATIDVQRAIAEAQVAHSAAAGAGVRATEAGTSRTVGRPAGASSHG